MKRILIIEDQAIYRDTISALLDMANFEVITAQNGKEGVSLARHYIPDLILCDIVMPELDGIGVNKLMQQQPETAMIPFIFLSAKSELEDIRNGMRTGADDYLTKPINQAELLEAIEVRLAKAAHKEPVAYDHFVAGNGAKVVDVHEIFQLRKEKLVARKEKIFQEGDYANYVYFVVSGTVKTSKTDYYGKSYTLDIHSTGDFFGYLPWQNHGEYPETATALESSRLALVSRKEFMETLARQPQLALRFLQSASRVIIDKNDRLLQLAYASVRERVAIALLKHRSLASGRLDLPMVSRDELASLVGTTKESLVRTLSEMKRDGIVELNGKEIHVHAPDQLMKSIGWY